MNPRIGYLRLCHSYFTHHRLGLLWVEPYPLRLEDGSVWYQLGKKTTRAYNVNRRGIGFLGLTVAPTNGWSSEHMYNDPDQHS
jgi:hypothetical protein